MQRVRPPGAWNGMRSAAPGIVLRWLIAGWLAGNAAVFALTFGVGHLLLGSRILGVLLLGAGGVTAWFTLLATRKARLLTPHASAEPTVPSTAARP